MVLRAAACVFLRRLLTCQQIDQVLNTLGSRFFNVGDIVYVIGTWDHLIDHVLGYVHGRIINQACGRVYYQGSTYYHKDIGAEHYRNG